MSCSILCRSANSPVSECNCRCGGDNHGEIDDLAEFFTDVKGGFIWGQHNDDEEEDDGKNFIQSVLWRYEKDTTVTTN